MDNAQKAIIVGVSLFITITLISVVVLITGIGNDAMRSSNKQLEGVSNNIASQLLADYDGTTITGASVIAAIKNFYDKPNFILAVDNSTVGTNGSAYNQNGWYSTKKKNGSAKLEASTDGKNFDNPPGRSSYFDKTKNYIITSFSKDL